MASYRKQKEALRAATFAFLAGIHSVTEEVDKNHSFSGANLSAEVIEAQRNMLEADYRRTVESPQAVEMLVNMLNEEELYPFGSDWSAEALTELVHKVVAPDVPIAEVIDEANFRFRFKKGFKSLLSDFASNIESAVHDRSTLDHWLVLILNASFLAGMTAAARTAENSKAYYAALEEIEDVTEPWGRYPQIMKALEKQLRRETKRRTGLVSDLDFE